MHAHVSAGCVCLVLAKTLTLLHCVGDVTFYTLTDIQHQQQHTTGQPCSLMQAAQLLLDNKPVRWGTCQLAVPLKAEHTRLAQLSQGNHRNTCSNSCLISRDALLHLPYLWSCALPPTPENSTYTCWFPTTSATCSAFVEMMMDLHAYSMTHSPADLLAYALERSNYIEQVKVSWALSRAHLWLRGFRGQTILNDMQQARSA